MLTQKQLHILACFTVAEPLSFTGLKARAKTNSNNLLQQALQRLETEHLILKTDGRYRLDITSPRIGPYQELITDQRLGSLPPADAQQIRRIRQAILKKAPTSAVVLFGSFADRSQKKDSDIDVAVFTDEDPKPIERAVKALGMRNLRHTDLHIISKNDFQEMLANAEFNLGKEIKQKHRVLANGAAFYELLATARNPPARRE